MPNPQYVFAKKGGLQRQMTMDSTEGMIEKIVSSDKLILEPGKESARKLIKNSTFTMFCHDGVELTQGRSTR